jgi:hypothetical protein
VVWNKTGVIQIYIRNQTTICVVSVAILAQAKSENVRHWNTSTRGEPEKALRILTSPHIVQVLGHVILDSLCDVLEHWLCCKVQLYAAIGAAALLELQYLEWAVVSVVVGELADHLSNRDCDAFKARWRALRFSNIEDVNVDIFQQEMVLSDVKLQWRILSWATRCAASRRWPIPE